ncbi:hypothetical protein B0H12DRAFT_1158158 [Mycena haematopus]|nr:hypothetical protein B0H12DRAFT_1158158 [Mycena haematopus]
MHQRGLEPRVAVNWITLGGGVPHPTGRSAGIIPIVSSEYWKRSRGPIRHLPFACQVRMTASSGKKKSQQYVECTSEEPTPTGCRQQSCGILGQDTTGALRRYDQSRHWYVAAWEKCGIYNWAGFTRALAPPPIPPLLSSDCASFRPKKKKTTKACAYAPARNRTPLAMNGNKPLLQLAGGCDHTTGALQYRLYAPQMVVLVRISVSAVLEHDYVGFEKLRARGGTEFQKNAGRSTQSGPTPSSNRALR